MTKESHCNIATEADYTGVKTVDLSPESPLKDYIQAMQLADSEVYKHYADPMLIAWYDKDRGFESPQHASECHVDSAIHGYIDYALYHGVTLKRDNENGRFLFFSRFKLINDF